MHLPADAVTKPPTVLPVIASAHCGPSAPAVPAGRRSAYEGQDMFDIHSVEIEWAGRPLKLETGKIARQADGAVLATWRNRRSRHRRFGKVAEAGPGLLPAHRQLPGKDLCRRQDPGWLLQARRSSVGKGNAGFAPDRPSDPPALPGRLQERHQVVVTVIQHDLENIRTSCRWLRFGRSDAVRRSLHGPGRRRARRLHQRRIRSEPASRRDGRVLARPRRCRPPTPS